jgi:hypothetical protein
MLSDELPSKNRTRSQIITIVIFLAILITLAIMFKAFQPRATHHNVTFRVESSGGFAVITYKDAHMKQLDGTQTQTPWERTWDNPSGTEVYLTAGNPSDYGKVKCYLRLDGADWKTMESEKSVACAGIVP